MKSVVHFYTGTGNSPWVARMLAQELKDVSLVPIIAENTHPEMTENVRVVRPPLRKSLFPRLRANCRLSSFTFWSGTYRALEKSNPF